MTQWCYDRMSYVCLNLLGNTLFIDTIDTGNLQLKHFPCSTRFTAMLA